MLHQRQRPLRQLCGRFVSTCNTYLFWYFDPWHVGAPGLSRPPPRLRTFQKHKGNFKNAKEVSKTIKSYGWYSGLCLVATVGQVWNS